MHSGTLRERVTIQRSASSTADTYGSVTLAWADVAEIPAEILYLTGSEAWKTRQVVPEATVQVTHRYYSDITTEDRYKWGSKYLNIISTTPDQKRTQQISLCREML